MTSKPSQQGTETVDPRRAAIGLLFAQMFIFALPSLKFIEFNIGGKLFLPELFCLVIFLCTLASGDLRLEYKPARIFVGLCLLWLCGQVVTDIIRDTPWMDYSRGWSRIAFTIINFSVLYLFLFNKKSAIVVFTAGLAVGGFLEFFLNPSMHAEGNPWKFGIGPPLTLLLILAATTLQFRWAYLRAGLVLLLSTAHLLLGFRSMAGICFLTSIYLIVQWFHKDKTHKPLKMSLRQGMAVFVILAASSFALIEGYSYAASHGLLGENAREQYEWQGYGIFGVLIGGRSEILVSGQAIVDSPLIGHGSWAKDAKYADALATLKRLLGYQVSDSEESDLIPTHSHLFGAWVEAGVAGAVVWIWLLALCWHCLTRLYQTKNQLAPLYAFICFTLIWDIFFSPYAGDRRLITPYYIIVLMTFASGFKVKINESLHRNHLL